MHRVCMDVMTRPNNSRPCGSPFGQAVRDARGALTQAEVAAALQLAPSTIYRIERGGQPSLSAEVALRRWAKRRGFALPTIDRTKAAA